MFFLGPFLFHFRSIYWSNNSRSLTTNSHHPQILLATCAWCPETTFSTGLWGHFGYLTLVCICARSTFKLSCTSNRSCQSMTSLYSATVSPVKDGVSSPLRPSNIGKPPLRALYDLLIAPMEGVCAESV